jgi:hypothetical protein
LVPRALVKKHTILPLFIDDDRLLVACVDQLEHELEEELQLRYGVPVRAVIATPRAVNQAIAKYYAPGMRDEAVAAQPVAGKRSAAGKPDVEKTKKSASAGPRKRYSQLSPEEQHQRKQLGYIIICWTVIFFMLPQILWGVGAIATPLFGLNVYICVALAALGGGAAYWWVTQRYWK